MKNKIICLVVLLCLIISSIFEIICYASGTDVTFTIENMNLEKGQTGVIVKVNMNCTNSFAAANLTFTYDSSVLEYVPYYNGNNEIDFTQNYGSTILNQGSPIGTVIINSDEVGKLYVGYMSMTSVAGKNGEFLKFKFNVKNNAAVGNSNISVNATTLKDGNGNNLTPEYTNGIVTVTEPEEQYSIIISDPSWTFLPPTQKRSLTATFDPLSFGNGKTITWSSEDTTIAEINPSTGEITAKANGEVTITATDGSMSDTYTLTVSGMLGDIDNDLNITSYDAYRALVLSSYQNIGNNVDENEVVILDVERNGSMSSNDAYLILKHSVGLISNF